MQPPAAVRGQHPARALGPTAIADRGQHGCRGATGDGRAAGPADSQGGGQSGEDRAHALPPSASVHARPSPRWYSLPTCAGAQAAAHVTTQRAHELGPAPTCQGEVAAVVIKGVLGEEAMRGGGVPHNVGSWIRGAQPHVL